MDEDRCERCKRRWPGKVTIVQRLCPDCRLYLLNFPAGETA